MGESIGHRILQEMLRQGISYGELSGRTGIYKSALQRYATGTTEKIPLEAIEKIAAAFGCPATRLIGWERTSEETKKTPAEARVDERLSRAMKVAGGMSPEDFDLWIAQGEQILLRRKP